MLPKGNISVLVDNESWILPFATSLVNNINMLGYSAELFRHQQNIVSGQACFLLGCTKIVSKEILKKNKHNLVVHESALPNGKGFAPMTWQILEGKNNIPVCLLEASSEVDSGDIWLMDEIELNGAELCDEWRFLQGKKTVQMCLDFILNYDDLKPVPQSGTGSFYEKRLPKDSEIDIHKTIAEQFKLLQIVDNDKYPAFFYIKNKRYNILISKN